MAAVQVEIKGNVNWLDQWLKRVSHAAPEVTLDIAKDIAADVRSHWSGHFPPASMPGSPPAMRAEALDRSVAGVLQESLSTGKITAVAIAMVAYASILEYGSRFMQARPFMRPAVKRAEKSFRGRWRALFK